MVQLFIFFFSQDECASHGSTYPSTPSGADSCGSSTRCKKHSKVVLSAPSSSFSCVYPLSEQQQRPLLKATEHQQTTHNRNKNYGKFIPDLYDQDYSAQDDEENARKLEDILMDINENLGNDLCKSENNSITSDTLSKLLTDTSSRIDSTSAYDSELALMDKSSTPRAAYRQSTGTQDLFDELQSIESELQSIYSELEFMDVDTPQIIKHYDQEHQPIGKATLDHERRVMGPNENMDKSVALSPIDLQFVYHYLQWCAIEDESENEEDCFNEPKREDFVEPKLEETGHDVNGSGCNINASLPSLKLNTNQKEENVKKLVPFCDKNIFIPCVHFVDKMLQAVHNYVGNMNVLKIMDCPKTCEQIMHFAKWFAWDTG